MDKRLKELRKVLNLTQQEFADKLKIKRAAISNYEIGRNIPVDSVVALICIEFNVNEKWLRTGEGDMFLPQNKDEEITRAMDVILQDEDSTFRKRFISAMLNMNRDEWNILEKKITEIAELERIEKEAASDGEPSTPMTPEQYHAEVDRQLGIEKKAVGK